MLSGQHVVGKGSCVGQTLQGRVQETCVAQVMETCSNAVTLVPFQAEPLWGKQDLLRKSNAIPTGHHHCMIQKKNRHTLHIKTITTYCCILKVALQQPFNINSKDKHLPCSLGLSTCSAVLLLPFTVAPIVGAIQAVLALESSVAEGLTLQLELLLSMSLEEKGVRELECLHRTDSRSDFSGGLSTMVIIHFLWKNRRQLNHF